jgi:uncharacterized cupredoxin-like copper-binding protein
MTIRVITLAVFAALWGANVQAAEGPPGHIHGHGAATQTDGQPGKAADVKRVVQVDALDATYNVKTIQVRAGETIKFVVTNRSKIDHEFAIASPKEHAEHREMMKQMPDMKHEEPNVVTVKPGETKELIWKFGRDANVEFACNIPGHWEGGMKGMFRVTR